MMTRHSNRSNSRRVGRGRRVGRARFSSKSVANTSTTGFLLMSMFLLILMSTTLNLILHEALSSTTLDSSLTNNKLQLRRRAAAFTATAKAMAKTSSSKTAVLVLFGVPKHFRLVWTSYMKNIVQRNPLMKFEVYMHMYSDLSQEPFSNARNDEISTILDSPDDIRAIWMRLRQRAYQQC